MKEIITAYIIRPGEEVGQLTKIPNDLKIMQDIVGGYIEAVTLASDVAIICNEEGRLLGLPYNCTIANADFVGNIILVGVDGEEFTDVPFTDTETFGQWLITRNA